MTRSLTRLTLLALAMSACAGSKSDEGTSSSPSDDDDATGDDDDGVVYTGCLADGIAVEAAAGADEARVLSAGEPIVMVHGPQGGWHIDVAGMVSNTLQNVAISATFTDVDTDIVVAGVDQQPTNQALVAWTADGCTGEFYGVRTYLDDIAPTVSQADICALEGATLRFDLTVTALEADPPPSYTTSIEVTAELDPNDVSACAAL